MNHRIDSDLQALGLSPSEARVYLALTRNGPLGASAIATITGLARTSVYPALRALGERGLVDAGKGYGGRFAAVPANRALPNLLSAEREAIAQREALARQLVAQISALAEPGAQASDELIQVLGSPRAIADRYNQLQREARQSIDVFTKPPFIVRNSNPVQSQVLSRGVRLRSVYERACLDDPAIGPYLASWLEDGEEARIYAGELPHKMAIFDARAVLMPLSMPSEQVKALLIQHSQLARSLLLAFEHLWAQSEPLAVPRASVQRASEPSRRPRRKSHRG